MASRIIQTLTGENLLRRSVTLQCFVRHGHRLRGKPPGVARTLEQRLASERAVDPELAKKVNIGFPHLKPARSEQLKERLAHLKAQRANPELEKASRAKTREYFLCRDVMGGRYYEPVTISVTVDPELVKQDWLTTSGPFHIKRLAEHYGVFEHLYGSAYFVPRVHLQIAFNNGDVASPVYYGNVLKPSEASAEPTVQFDASFNFRGSTSGEAKAGDSWWTLVLTNPDGHFSEHDKEYCHWFV
ncbi:hypothetical protein RP20_CCG010410 [Aedes albopictus]|nr:hypothetical protein RP20_CCG010410 [Aedes albopictus]